MSKRSNAKSKLTPPATPPGVLLLHVPADSGPKAGEEFDEMIAEAMTKRPRLIVVDLSDRNFISTVMLGLLLKLRRDTAAFNSEVRLAEVQPAVRGVLSVCRLDRLFGVFPSIAAAIDGTDPNSAPRA